MESIAPLGARHWRVRCVEINAGTHTIQRYAGITDGWHGSQWAFWNHQCSPNGDLESDRGELGERSCGNWGRWGPRAISLSPMLPGLLARSAVPVTSAWPAGLPRPASQLAGGPARARIAGRPAVLSGWPGGIAGWPRPARPGKANWPAALCQQAGWGQGVLRVLEPHVFKAQSFPYQQLKHRYKNCT